MRKEHDVEVVSTGVWYICRAAKEELQWCLILSYLMMCVEVLIAEIL